MTEMNLIEQLGGYEAVKGAAQNYRNSAEKFERAMLKYRRQHNIFEVGDKVIIESYRNTYITCGRPSQYSIGDLMLIHIVDGNVIEDDDYNFIDYRDVRHATDEEIEAGKRLEVK